MSQDRISALPDSLIHQILSTIDVKEVVQTSLLSKRWKNIWVSLPVLDFHRFGWSTHHRFMQFIHRVLLLRDETSTIQKLSISCLLWNYESDIQEPRVLLRDLADAVHVDHWVSTRVIHQVFLEFVHLLTNTSFTGLNTTLKLTTCSFVLPSSGNFVINLPNAENLVLRDCNHGNINTLIIDAPELKHLIVENLREICKPHCEIKLAAPNATSVEFIGYMYEDYHLETMVSVVHVEIETMLFAISMMGRKRFFGCLYKILGAVAAARFLTTQARDFQILRKLPKGFKQIPVPFQNLRYLKLTKWHTDGYIGPMARMLESFPNLETLVLERVKDTLDPIKRGGDWRAQLSFKCKFGHLKFIEIQDITGCENEVIFIGFVAKNATALEKITVDAWDVFFREEEEEKGLVDFTKKVQLLPMAAASSVAISLICKSDTGDTTIARLDSTNKIKKK